MDQKVDWTIVIGLNCIKEMVPTAEIAKTAFVGTQAISQFIPSRSGNVLRRDARPHQAHSTTAIGYGEPPPIRLAGSDSSASRQRRFPRARVGEKYDLICNKAAWNPGMKLPKRFSR